MFDDEFLLLSLVRRDVNFGMEEFSIITLGLNKRRFIVSPSTRGNHEFFSLPKPTLLL